MHTYTTKAQEGKSQLVASEAPNMQSIKEPTLQFADNRPAALAQRKLQEMVNNSPQVTQLEARLEKGGNRGNNSNKVTQFLGFRPKQDEQVVKWIIDNGLWDVAPFVGLCQSYVENNGLDDNDAEAIAMLFLTMVESYRNFPHANVAINYLYNRYYGFHAAVPVWIPQVNPPATVSEFTNKYKTFYHLYNRALNAGHAGIHAISAVHAGMTGLSENLGNQIQDTLALPGGVVATDEQRIQRIYTAAAAAAGDLRFHNQASAVSHLVKHGAMYNHYNKITGQEGAQNLGLMLDNYVEDANYAIRVGDEQPGIRDLTLGRYVYTFTTEFERVMVSCAADGSNAFIATYFWNEPPGYVNDLTPTNGINPNTL